MKVLGDADAVFAAELVALFYLRDGMLKSMDPLLRQLQIIPKLISLADPELSGHLQRYFYTTSMKTFSAGILPHYAVSWVLTWMAHEGLGMKTTARLFDFFLSQNPAMIFFFAAAVKLCVY